MTDPDKVIPALRAAFDDVLAQAGFTWNGDDHATDPITVLYEAVPAIAAERVPRVASHLGDLDSLCLDLWITYDDTSDVLAAVRFEGAPATAVLRELGHHAAAEAIETATTFDAQVAAYAAGFAALFGA